MKRFYDDDFDPNELFPYKDKDEDEELDEDEQAAMDYLGKEGLMQVINLDLAHKELRIALLEKAAKIASESILWRFLSANKKMEKIIIVFHQLKALTEID